MPVVQSFRYVNPVGFRVPITAPSTAKPITKLRRAVKPAASIISCSVREHFGEEMVEEHVVVETRGDCRVDGDVDEHVRVLSEYGQRSVTMEKISG